MAADFGQSPSNSIRDDENFQRFLSYSHEELAFRAVEQLEEIARLRSKVEYKCLKLQNEILKEQLATCQFHNNWLEDELEEANDVIYRLEHGLPVEWENDGLSST
jgi:hypothetical protein